MPKEKGGKKNKASDVERIASSALIPIIESRGYEVWDIIYEKEGAMWYLKVLFDKPDGGIDDEGAMWYLKVLFDKPDGGIDDEECEEITAPINDAVDTLPCLDLIDVLEVGSPGLNRMLRKPDHFKKMQGNPITAAFRDENGKTLYIKGELLGYNEDDGILTIKSEEEEKNLPISKCGRITLDL